MEFGSTHLGNDMNTIHLSIMKLLPITGANLFKDTSFVFERLNFHHKKKKRTYTPNKLIHKLYTTKTNNKEQNWLNPNQSFKS